MTPLHPRRRIACKTIRVGHPAKDGLKRAGRTAIVLALAVAAVRPLDAFCRYVAAEYHQVFADESSVPATKTGDDRAAESLSAAAAVHARANPAPATAAKPAVPAPPQIAAQIAQPSWQAQRPGLDLAPDVGFRLAMTASAAGMGSIPGTGQHLARAAAIRLAGEGPVKDRLSAPALFGISTYTWNGGGMDNLFSTAANWTGGVPVDDGTANLHFAGTTRLAPFAQMPYALNSISFNSGAGSFILSGSPLTLGAGGISQNSANPQTINNLLALGAPQTWTLASGAGALNVNGAVDNGGNTLTVNASTGTTAALSGGLSGAGGLTLSGTGGVVLGGANTYTGATAVNAGSLTLSSGTLGATDITVGAGGSFQVTATGALPFTSNGVGSLTLDGTTANPATATFGGSGAFYRNAVTAGNSNGGAGVITQSGGTLSIGDGGLSLGNAASSTGTYNLSGGRLSTDAVYVGYNGAGTFNQPGGTFDTGSVLVGYKAGGSGTYGLQGGSVAASNVFIGYNGAGTFNQSGGTFRQGGGSFILGYNAGSTGTYNLSGGLLSAGDPTAGEIALGVYGSGVFNQTGGTFTTNGKDLTLGRLAGSSGTYSLGGGTLSTGNVYVGYDGAGTVNQTGGTFIANGKYFFLGYGQGNGTYTLSGGTLSTNGVVVIGGSTFNFDGGTLQDRGDSAFILAGNGGFTTNVLAGGARVDTAGFDATLAANLLHGAALGSTTDGGLTKLGAGTLTLDRASTYTGTTTVGGGTLTLSGFGRLNGTKGTALTFANTGTFNAAQSASTVQGMGALSFQAGEGTVQSTYAGSGNSGLTFASLGARAAGATGDFVSSGGTNGSTNRITLTGHAAGFIDQGTFFDGGNYAYVSGAGGYVRALSYTSDPGTTSYGGQGTIPSTLYAQTTGSILTEQSNTFTTLKINGDYFFGLANGATVTVNGLLKANGGAGGSATITGGTALRAASGAELVIRTDTANDALTINTPVVNNGNGSNALTKSGAGTLTLGAANTYTGATTIDAGTLTVGNGGSLGATDITVRAGASFQITGSGTLPATGGNGTTSGSSLTLVGTTGAPAIVTLAGTGTLYRFGVKIGSQPGEEGILTQSSGTLDISPSSIGLGDYLAVGFSGVGTYNLQGGTLNVRATEVGQFGGGGTINQTGGTFNAEAVLLSNDIFSTGTYNLSGTGALNVSNSLNVGESGSGTFNQGGGNLTTGTLNLGEQKNSSGTVNLSVGTLKANNITVGNDGSGTFNQTGGTVTNAGSLSLSGSSSAYNLSGADSTLSTQQILVGGGSTFSQSGGKSTVSFSLTVSGGGTYNLKGGTLSAESAYVGYDGGGVFNQTGGSFTAGSFLTLGNNAGSSGTYNLSGASSTLTGYFNVYVGYNGSGTVNQTGGSFGGGSFLTLGNNAGSSGTYNLSGASSTVNVEEVYVGDGGSGTVNQSGGAFTLYDSTDVYDGGYVLYLGNSAGGVGTYNLSGGTLAASNFDVGYKGTGTFNQTGGTATISGSNYQNGLIVGYTASGVGTINLSGGSLKAGLAYVGYGGSGTVNHSVGTFAADYFFLGYAASGEGTYNLSGANSTLSAFELNVGYNGSGTFNQAGGSVTVQEDLVLGYSNGSGTYNLQAGSLSTGYAFVGTVSTGTVNQTGGSFTSDSALYVGYSTGSNGTYNLSAGTLDANSTVVGRKGIGTINQSGLTIATISNSLVLGSDVDGTGTYNLSGGNLTTARTQVGDNHDVSTFNQTGGTHTTTVLSLTGKDTASQGTYNLTGGTLTAGTVTSGDNNVRGTSTFNFGGGTLQASADNPAFFQDLTTANVQAGGAKIDTQSYHVAAAQPLLHDAALGNAADGGLTKLGGGVLTLTGASTYTGPTTVRVGTLAVDGALTGPGTVRVLNGATLAGNGSVAGDVVVLNNATFAPGEMGTGQLKLGNSLNLNGASTAAFTLAGTAAGSQYPQALVAGQINLGTAATLNLTLASGYSPSLGDKFFLIDGTDPLLLVQGGFSNAPLTGSIFSADGVLFLINYVDGDPDDPSHTLFNDVSVTVVPEPSAWACLIVGASLLGVVARCRPALGRRGPSGRRADVHFSLRHQ